MKLIANKHQQLKNKLVYNNIILLNFCLDSNLSKSPHIQADNIPIYSQLTGTGSSQQ